MAQQQEAFMQMQAAFESYLRDTFEVEYDPTSVDHLTKQAIFEAGWDARPLPYRVSRDGNGGDL
jgi:hypothetical protein